MQTLANMEMKTSFDEDNKVLMTPSIHVETNYSHQVGYVSYTPHNPYLLCPRSNLTRSSISVTCASPSCASFGSSPFPYTKSRSNSLRSCYSDQTSMIVTPDYQCSDPAEILQIGKQISSILPLLKGSIFLSILFFVFVFYAITTLISVLLIVFSIWL